MLWAPAHYRLPPSPKSKVVEASIGQAILFRGAGLGTVWPQFLALAGIGSVLFAIALHRFRKTISQTT